MIKNIIFDIEGVLMEYDLNKYLDYIGMVEEKRIKVKEIIFTSKEWRKCLNGEISNEYLINKLVERNPEYSEEIKDVLNYDNIKYMMLKKDDSIEYLKKLKNNGYKIYILSNLKEDTYEYIKSITDFIDIADGTIFSCFVNKSKPDQRIYEDLLNKYNLLANESIFIDDKIKNIEASIKLGFNGIVFEKLEQVIEEVNMIIINNK